MNLIKEKYIDFVINTTGADSESIAKSFSMRRTALMNRVFYVTTITAAQCLTASIEKLKKDKDFDVFCLQKL